MKHSREDLALIRWFAQAAGFAFIWAAFGLAVACLYASVMFGMTWLSMRIENVVIDYKSLHKRGGHDDH